MISIEITEVKKFMNGMLLGTRLDKFRCLRYLITGYAEFSMEGDLLWSEVKPLVLAIIKGHETPDKMKYVFALKQEQIPILLARAGITDADDVSSFSFTLSFLDGRLLCTTGFARGSFTMDRTPEQYWDQLMKQFIEDMIDDAE